jgi:hypothetical protein
VKAATRNLTKEEREKLGVKYRKVTECQMCGKLCRQRTPLRDADGNPIKRKYEHFYEVDHIQPVGSLKCAEDLPQFVERLFCEIDNYRVLCIECHKKVTHGDKDAEDSTD